MPCVPVSPQRLAAGAFVLLLALVTSPACTARGEDETAPTRLRVGFGIGPSVRREAAGVMASMLYREGLVTHDWSGRTLPGLIEHWSWTDVPKTLHVTLKQGVVFHDGSPLTAEIVLRALRGLAEARALGFTYVTDMSVTGPLTLDIRLSQPDAFLLPELSDLRLTHPDNADIGTGPFRLVRREPKIETVRFDRYHGGAPALTEIDITVYESQRSAWAALMRQEVDVVQEVSRESVEAMKGSTEMRSFSAVQPFYVPVWLNHSHAALRHTEVRRAMIEALDRRAIIEHAMRGFGQVADAPIWPQHWAYPSPAPPHYAYDPASARARLDRAGFPMKARAGAPASRFSFRCLVQDEDPQYERIALMVRRQLFDVGIDMAIEMTPVKTIGERGAAGDFDAMLVRVNSSRTLNLTYQFWRAALFKTGYTGTNKAFDAFRLADSDEETRAAVTELVERFHEDVPALFIAWLQVVRAVDTSFDVGDGHTPDPFASLWQWKPVGHAK